MGNEMKFKETLQKNTTLMTEEDWRDQYASDSQ
jgi:hypothetical protein